MQQNVIYPTHHCFDDSLELLVLLGEDIDTRKEIRLVHAICTSPNGELYSHAWVEDYDECYFSGLYMEKFIYYGIKKEDWYEGAGVKEATKYSFAQAVRKNLETNNFGPWESKYKELCIKREEGKK